MLKQKFLYFLPFLACLLVYLLALPIDVPEVDAAQYAAIAIETFQRGEWLHITDGGRDYLDKPPLIFWTAALSYKIFGIHNFSYKLPSLLFWILGVFSTFQLAKRFYNEKIAYLSALFLASCVAGFMITHDCRTDTILTGAVIFSIWQMLSYGEERKIKYFLGGFTGIALAMLAKGPIGLMVPILAIGGHWILKKEWRNLFRWEWILGILWVLLLLSPMLWGLYTQFDLHPEKVVNGESGVSGIKFYFWTQSFGRITGESQWKDDSDFFFLWHTTLWAFLPWGIPLFIGLFFSLKTLYKRQKSIEYFSLCGFLLPLIALSFSHYKLPHYIFVTYPLAAILAASQVENIFSHSKLSQYLIYIQGFTAFLIGIAAIWIPILSFPHQGWMLYGTLLLVGIFIAYFSLKQKPLYQFILPALIAVIGANIAANGFFYPKMMEYQACTQAGYYVKKSTIPLERFHAALLCACAIEMPTQRRLTAYDSGWALGKRSEKEPIYLLTDENLLKHLENTVCLNIKTIQKFEHFPPTQIDLAFLNAKTRKPKDIFYLIEIQGHKEE